MRRLTRLISAATGATLIALTIIAFMPPEKPWTGLPECLTEDATYDCIWDAENQGNGHGTSFYVLDGEAYQLPANH